LLIAAASGFPESTRPLKSQPNRISWQWRTDLGRRPPTQLSRPLPVGKRLLPVSGRPN